MELSVLTALLVAWSAAATCQLVAEEDVVAAETAAQADLVNQQQLDAGSSHLHNQNILLNADQGRRTRVDRRRARRQRKRDRKAEKRAHRLEARRALAAERQASALQFRNLNAQVSRQSSRNFALELLIEHEESYSANVSYRSGSAANAGTLLLANSAVNAQEIAQTEAVRLEEAAANDQLNAVGKAEDVLNAEQTAGIQDQTAINAQEQSLQIVGLQDGAAAADVIGVVT